MRRLLYLVDLVSPNWIFFAKVRITILRLSLFVPICLDPWCEFRRGRLTRIITRTHTHPVAQLAAIGSSRRIKLVDVSRLYTQPAKSPCKLLILCIRDARASRWFLHYTRRTCRLTRICNRCWSRWIAIDVSSISRDIQSRRQTHNQIETSAFASPSLTSTSKKKNQESENISYRSVNNAKLFVDR